MPSTWEESQSVLHLVSPTPFLVSVLFEILSFEAIVGPHRIP